MLPSQFAYDTETGDCDGTIRCVLVQICATFARSMEEVILYEGEDSIKRFLADFEDTGWDMDCHAYNLNYEFSWLLPYLKGYMWVDTRQKRLAPGQWTALADPMAVYRVRICNHKGKVLTITDDMRRMGSVTMSEAADSVRKDHPDWWDGMEEVKEDADDLYNVWWTFPRDSEEFQRFIHYAKVDAYSQAMIASWLEEQGANRSLTSASAGLKMALHIRYGKEENPDGAWKERKNFTTAYPPLSRSEQDILESSLMGGYVHGEPGTWEGVFTHIDYSSSYPYEYAFGQLFRGKVTRLERKSAHWSRIIKNKAYLRWYLVSFDFDGLKPAGIPVLNGKECRTWDEPMYGCLNKKMIRGHVEQRLMTETYLREITYHYNIHNLEILEVWFAKRSVGDFYPFIEKCYDMKSRKELKGTATRSLWKLYMNGGIHGKTITKTRRKKVIFPDGERQIVDEVNEPELCGLIGFTAMMNARERLIRACRTLQMEGYKVMMCDTDSIVVNAPESEVRRILGDEAFVHEGAGIKNLGKFEFEEDEDGNVEFDLFKCWGLKRYAEFHEGKFRKSAFAGMHDEFQEELLPSWETDGTVYSWEQLTATQTEYGKVVMLRMKHAKRENIWFEEPEAPPVTDGSSVSFDEYLAALRAALKEADYGYRSGDGVLFIEGDPRIQREVEHRIER